MMKHYRFPETRGWKIAFFALLFAMLMLSRSGMCSHTLLGFYESQILMLGSIALAGLTFVVVKRRELKQICFDRRMGLVIAAAILVLLPMVVKRDWQLMYFSILICIFFAVFLSYFVRLEETAKAYVLILCVLSVYAILATYVLRILPDRGIVRVPVFVNDKGRDFYNFFLSFVSIREVKNRNFGIFREPGVYQFFLLVALYLSNYHICWEKRRSLWIANAILVVTMLSTMATGGVIELGLFIVIVFFEKKLYRDKRILVAAIIAAVAAIAVLAVSFATKNAVYRVIYDTLIQKFVDRTDSVTERAEAIAVDIRLFLQNPVFGERLAAVLHGVENNTTSTLVLFAVFGFVVGCFHVLTWAALVWKKERHIIWNLALLAVLAMSFNTQNLTVDIYFWLFPVMALAERGLPLLKLPGKC